jgi:tRNA threonylcarbamoyl adenosine modification protein YeaZ
MYLAIDTSSEITGLAVIHNGQVLTENTWRCDRNHTVELLPHLEEMLKQAKLDMKSIKGIIVALGPGSFNGLRVGLGTAKGLAFSLNIPITGIGTLEAAAYQYAHGGLPVCAVFNAGRGEISCASYRLLDGKWLCTMQANITTVAELCRHTTAKTLFCGEPTEAMREQISAALGEDAVFPTAEMMSRAAALARLGESKLEQGLCDDAATLQPVYLRPPHISQPKSKGAGAKDAARLAVIWDMDGTIADTAEQHIRAWQAVFSRRGIAFSREDFKRTFGLRNDTVIGSMLGAQTTKEDIAIISREKNELFRESLLREGMRPMPGAIELIKALHEMNIPMAIASSAPRQNLDIFIKMLGIAPFFKTVVSGEEVERGKPDPQSFLLAAEKLQATPRQCVVIEDAVGGIEAARAAGMHSIALAASHTREELKKADLVVDSLSEVSVPDIEKLIQR